MPENVKGTGKKVNEEKKENFREKVTKLLELPKEVVLNIPKMTIIGSGNLIIENYKGIIEYDGSRIRINTGSGIIRLNGRGLIIKEITSEDLLIEGDIGNIEFLK